MTYTYVKVLLSLKRLFLFFSLVLFTNIMVGQTDSCETSLPFCTSDIYTFPASTNTTAQSGPDYGCLNLQPNPAWYYLKIGVPGDIIITMESMPPRDIDFICWGPFPDAISPCTAELTNQMIVDCSYANWTAEECYIPDGQIGEHYILVITNYSNQPCEITFLKTSGTGETDCTIVPPPVSNNGPLCVGDTLKLFADTVANTVYNWTGPDSFASTQQNPVIPNATLANSGAYTLIVNTGGNTSDPTFTTVIITALPIVDFTIDVNDTICSNELVTYTGSDISGTNITNWNWTFGDGNVATNQIVQHLYNTGGYFNSTLVAINSGSCTDTASLYIKVIANVSAIAGSDETICKNGSFDFSTSFILPDTINCDSLLWIGGMGNFDDPKVLHPVYFPEANELGSVQLGLVAFGRAPCENDTNFMILTIDSIPNVSFIIIPNDTVCINELVSFNAIDNNNTTIQNWQWDFGDGNFGNTQNETHTYTSILEDSVKLIAVNSYTCRDSMYAKIVVKNPVIDFSFTPKPACIGDTINFSGIGDVNFTDWNWDFGDGIIGIGKNISHLFAVPDTFEVTLNVCSKTAIDSAAVYTQSFADAGSPETLCETHPHDFALSSLQPVALNFDSLRWSGGMGSYTNPQILLPVYFPGLDETGPVQLRLIAFGKLPCGNDTSYVTITFDSIPDVGFTYSPNDSICVDEMISFTDVSTTNVTSWLWDFGDGISGTLQYPIHSYNLAGNYNVKLITSNNNSCSDSLTQLIQINPLPQPDFLLLPNDTVCAEMILTLEAFDIAGTNITDWNWDFGDGNVGTGQNVNHIYALPGDYSITLYVLNNNSCTGFKVKTVHIVSLPESDFTISPNDST